MSGRQILLGAPLSFGIFMLGTVLPNMVLIYAIFIPRYLKLTGSFATTVILGGVTYAAIHIVEGWSVFSTPRNAALSLIFVALQYLRSRHDQNVHHPAHRKRLGSRDRIPCRRTTCSGRYTPYRQGVRHKVSCSTASDAFLKRNGGSNLGRRGLRAIESHRARRHVWY